MRSIRYLKRIKKAKESILSVFNLKIKEVVDNRGGTVNTKEGRKLSFRNSQSVNIPDELLTEERIKDFYRQYPLLVTKKDVFTYSKTEIGKVLKLGQIDLENQMKEEGKDEIEIAEAIKRVKFEGIGFHYTKNLVVKNTK